MHAPETSPTPPERPARFCYDDKDVVLETRQLRKEFHAHRGRDVVRAVDGLSFQPPPKRDTRPRGRIGLRQNDHRQAHHEAHRSHVGRDHSRGGGPDHLPRDEELAYRRRVQMIFQDPYASMNPHFKVKNVLEEPLLIHRIGGLRSERMDMVAQVMDMVKMSPASEFMERYPHMLSGGQRQRVAMARTLILRPQIIIADEPVSMIDLSTRAEILHLMKSIQREMELSFVYVTHDISTARFFTDRIAVMYLGRIVEIGRQDEVIDHPIHPYTRALIAAVCEPVPGRVGIERVLQVKGEIPSAAAIPTGCRFHPRCLFATKDCAELPEPELEDAGGGHLHACRRWKEI